jgi:hypothetical protein
MLGRLGLVASLVFGVFVVFGAAACGKTVSFDKPDAKGSGGSDGGAGGDGGGWQTLISRSWSVSAGEQTYECDRIQVPNDMYINAFSPMSPIGTHHQVLTIDASDTETGDYDCNAESGTLSGEMLFASGIGTPAMTFPAGVAVHLTAGEWINLNIHLFDEQDNALNGVTGVQVKTVPAAEVQNVADMTFSGTFTIDVPSDGQPHTASGGCSAPADWTVFSLWPHEHELGTNQEFQVNGSTILNQPFSFTSQTAYPMNQMQIHQGDQILTTCTYMLAAATCSASQACTVGTCGSDSMCHVTFGQSTTEEMCFTGIYKYPAGSSTFSCVAQ